MDRLYESPAALSRLIAWKLLQSVRRLSDRKLGGHARRVASADAHAREWRRVMERHDKPIAQSRIQSNRVPLWLPNDSLAWAAETCSEADMQWADRAIRGEFELLGSGQVQLGDPPAWRRDLYTGVEWPNRPLDDADIHRGDGSDIRTVWELSRCRHFLPLARAFAKTRDVRYRDAFTRHVSSFIADNPVGMGPHWLSPMDAGIRATNWVLAAEIFGDDAGIGLSFWESILSNLHATASFVERYLEWHPVYRGNHYVANGVALVYLGTFFQRLTDGERWLRRGARILESEIRYQVGVDGVSFESSLAYHRFVTECFGWAAEVLRRVGVPPSAEYESRLRRMFAFIDAYLPAGDLAPMLGDADDGRLHAVSAVAEAEPRRHRLGLPERWWPENSPGPGAFPQGGFYILRDGADHLVVRCGRVGLRGAGSHDHNDQLSFELCVSGRRVVSDSGTFTYTRDLATRFAFRSTTAHSVVQLGSDEQNPISIERPWRVLQDRTRAECLRFLVDDRQQVFEGVHHGFAHRASGATCLRRIAFDRVSREWTIVDDIDGHGVEDVAWRLHLATMTVEETRRSETEWLIHLPGARPIMVRVILPPSMDLVVHRTAASDRYGVQYDRACLLARGRGSLPMQFRAAIRALDS